MDANADKIIVDGSTETTQGTVNEGRRATARVLGAGWGGARAFPSTARPGISLMNELIGFGYYAEIPAVIIDVQRTGPSTGMPTRTQQSDLLSCADASARDPQNEMLRPHQRQH